MSLAPKGRSYQPEDSLFIESQRPKTRKASAQAEASVLYRAVARLAPSLYTRVEVRNAPYPHILQKRVLSGAWRCNPNMFVGLLCHRAPAGGAFQKTKLHEVRFVHFLDRRLFF